MGCLIPSFDVLTEEQVKKINENSYLVSHKKDEVVFKQDKPISHLKYVKSGLIKVFKEGEKEKTAIVKIVTSESFLGLSSFFNYDRYQFSATTLEVSEIIYVNSSVFKEILNENGKYASNFLKMLSIEAIQMLDKIINVSQKQVTGRLAEVLLFFAIKIYKSYTYTLPVSRIELSELVFTTKESISRTLTEFKNDKIIEIEDKNVFIKSPELLQILSKLG